MEMDLLLFFFGIAMFGALAASTFWLSFMIRMNKDWEKFCKKITSEQWVRMDYFYLRSENEQKELYFRKESKK